MRVLETAGDRRDFQKLILRDLDRFDEMLSARKAIGGSGDFVGVEQELQFINERYEPVNVGDKVKQALHDTVFKEEYARFNFEVALLPEPFNADVFENLTDKLTSSLKEIDDAAAKYGASPILCAILPSLRQEHISVDALTRTPRYQQLYDLRYRVKESGEYEYQFHGVDDLVLRDAESVLGGVFTSLQLHWQLAGETAASEYNWSQLIAAPCLAVACCSPLFLGKRLWHETRISLFEQTSDIRRRHLESFEGEPPRASLGAGWVDRIDEVWRQDLAAYSPAITPDKEDGADRRLGRWRLPNLQFFNSTIYRWNRLCYGIGPGDGPTIRIESRALPAGLTLRDEIANAALWWGLMMSGAELGADLAKKLPFSKVRENFRRAARDGMECQLTWLDGKTHDVHRILLDDLIPLAARNLRALGVSNPDWRLRPVAHRASSRRTASRWMLDNFEHLRKDYDVDESGRLLTKAIAELAKDNLPVADWPSLRTSPSRYGRHHALKENERMALRAEDALALAEHRFRWEETDRLPAIDENGDRIMLHLEDVKRARKAALDTVSEAVRLARRNHRAQNENNPGTLEAFGRRMPLKRIIASRESGRKGPLLVIMAGLHGNELNAVAAADSFVADIEPECGGVVAMLGNLPALKVGQRYCGTDLNRAFNSGSKCEPPEANEIKDIIDTLRFLAADREHFVVLDLHGTSGHAPPYVSALSSLSGWSLADHIPIPHVTGFEKMFAGTLVEYADAQGWKSVTCEIGCISEPTSVDNGVHFLSLVAHHLGLIALDDEEKLRYMDALKAHCPTTETYAFVYRHGIKPEDEFKMLPGFVSFQKVHEGECVATDRNGDVCVPCNGRLLMPLYQEQGDDGFFIVN